MSDAGRSTAWTVGLIAVAASMAIVSGLYWWRVRTATQDRHVLRGVRDILSEFSARMEELEAKLNGGTPAKA